MRRSRSHNAWRLPIIRMAYNARVRRQSLELMTPELVRFAYRNFVVPRQTVIAIAGNISVDNARQQVEDAFNDWPRVATEWPRRWSRPFATVDASQVTLQELPVANTCVMINFPVCGSLDEDFVPLSVFEALLGGGTGSRLFRTVREEKHLAYEVASRLPVQAHASIFSHLRADAKSLYGRY